MGALRLWGTQKSPVAEPQGFGGGAAGGDGRLAKRTALAESAVAAEFFQQLSELFGALAFGSLGGTFGLALLGFLF